MRSDLSGPFVTEMNAHKHELVISATIHCLHGPGDIFISDRSINILGVPHWGIVPKDGWGAIGSVEQRDSNVIDVQETEITFINQVLPPALGSGRLSDYLRLDLHTMEVDIFFNFRYSGTFARALALTGIAQGSPSSWNTTTGKLVVRGLTQKYLDRSMMNVIDPLTYPDADIAAINKVIPIVVGIVEHVPGNIIANLPIFDPKDPNRGSSRVIESEAYVPSGGNPGAFGIPAITEVQYDNVPIRSGDLGTGLSSGMNAYVDALLSELKDQNELIFASRTDHGPRVVSIGNGGTYQQIVVPFTVPADITDPVLQNISNPLYRNPDENPGNITWRVSKTLTGYGVPYADFYGGSNTPDFSSPDDQSIGYYGWPSGDVARRNMIAKEVTTAARDNNGPFHSLDAPLEPGRTYYMKWDALNVNQVSDSDISGTYFMPIEPMSPPTDLFDNLQIFTEEALGTKDFGTTYEKLGGAPYISMSIRGGGGASVYTPDTSPLQPQSGGFVSVFQLDGQGLLVRALSAALQAGGSDATASIDVVSLNPGSTLGSTVLSLSFTADDFTTDLEVLFKPTPPGQPPRLGYSTGTYYRVRKNVPLTLLPPGRYAVKFSGSTQRTLTRQLPGEPAVPPSAPMQMPLLLAIGVGGRPPSSATPISRGGIGVPLSPPPQLAPPTPAAPLAPRQIVTTPAGEYLNGAFEIHGARFEPRVDLDGYSKISIDNLGTGGSLSDLGRQRPTCFIDFDCVLPSGAAVSATIDTTNNETHRLSPLDDIESVLILAGLSSTLRNRSAWPALAGSVIKFDGLFADQITFKEAILKLCRELHVAFEWSLDKVAIRDLRKLSYLPGSAPTGYDFLVSRSICAAADRLVSVGFTGADSTKIVNFINMRYERDWSTNSVARTDNIPLIIQSIAPYRNYEDFVDVASIKALGKLPEEVDLDFITDDASTLELGTLLLVYKVGARETLEVTLQTPGLIVEVGDTLAFSDV